jgi:hypothetical protein
MLSSAARFDATGDPAVAERPASALAGLFAPLDHLLISGGDPRLNIEPASGLNEYGCRPLPCPETLSFSSSTATSISRRALDRVADARDALMRSAIAIGIEAAFDARIETMRDELRCCLGLASTSAEIVFSPSGTDAQLQALFLARALSGAALTTIVVAADQTGSGTEHTARGHHFNAATSNGQPVTKAEPVAGLAGASTAVGLLDEHGDFRSQAETDARVIRAIERALARGGHVLLQIMDGSKLGWRAPSEPCLEEIAARWPDRVRILVDACQMRLGRPRLRNYLDRGYMVLVTGSKFFTGPAFSGALLVPAALSRKIDAIAAVAPGLLDYCSRSDWPKAWPRLRAQFPVRQNFGQWLRWEAALEEIRTYYAVPDHFRLEALKMFHEGVERIVKASPSLRLLPPQPRPDEAGCDDEELAQPTIFSFAVLRGARALPLAECREIYRALARDSRDAAAAKPCLIGQPVALGSSPDSAAVLRINASARLVTEAWSSGQDAARGNVQRQLAGVGAIVARLERLLADRHDLNSVELCHGS